MNHENDDYWGTLLLQMAQDAKEDGDIATAEMLKTAALRYFDGVGRLAGRLAKFEARLDNDPSRRA